MSFQKISAFATAILAVTVVVLAFIAHAQLSKTRQMREDMASLQQAVEAENQEFQYSTPHRPNLPPLETA